MKKNLILTIILFFLTGVTTGYMPSDAHEMNDVKFETKVTITKKVPIYEYQIIYKNVVGTVYHAVPEQTDSTPLITADGSRIDTTRVNELRWIAVSRDLINLKTKRYNFTGKLNFKDTVWIDYDKKAVLEFAKKHKLSEKKTGEMIAKYEKIKGYWIVKDTMGDYYWKPQKTSPEAVNEDMMASKEYKIQNGIVYKKHYQRNWIDFLQHPKTGMLHYWNKNIIITKKIVVGHQIIPIVQDELVVNG